VDRGRRLCRRRFDDPVAASVTRVEVVPCSFDRTIECELVTLTIDDGARAGQIYDLEPATTTDA
jgi:hypothetical protein